MHSDNLESEMCGNIIYGWCCPICKRVYGPNKLQCLDCNMEPELKRRQEEGGAVVPSCWSTDNVGLGETKWEFFYTEDEHYNLCSTSDINISPFNVFLTKDYLEGAKKYTKRAVTVRAKQIKLKKDNAIPVVQTLEGTMRGKEGDYLIEGIKGELYICDQEIFNETYSSSSDEKKELNKPTRPGIRVIKESNDKPIKNK